MKCPQCVCCAAITGLPGARHPVNKNMAAASAVLTDNIAHSYSYSFPGDDNHSNNTHHSNTASCCCSSFLPFLQAPFLMSFAPTHLAKHSLAYVQPPAAQDTRPVSKSSAAKQAAQAAIVLLVATFVMASAWGPRRVQACVHRQALTRYGACWHSRAHRLKGPGAVAAAGPWRRTGCWRAGRSRAWLLLLLLRLRLALA